MKGTRCRVTDEFIVKVRKREKTKKGTIVGFFLNPYWHPYTYRAFHIEFDDGTKGTRDAKSVMLLKEVNKKC